MASVADTGDQAPPAPPPPPETVVVRRRRSLGWRIAQWVAIVLALLLAAAAAFLLWLNTDSGRQFIVGQINKLEFASGLKIKIDRIDGSIWSDVTIHGLTLSDPQGEFFTAGEVQMSYTPMAYVRESRIDIASLVIPQARLDRNPALRPSGDPDAPLIPDLLLDIHSLRIDRLELGEQVTGQRRHVLSIAGDVHLANREARTNLDVAAIAGPDLAGGDRMRLRLDAAPEQNRFDLELRVDAPGDGFVSSMTGIEQRLRAEIRGQGNWENWVGRARAALDDDGFADLSVQAQNGRFSLNGPMRPDLFVTGPAQRLTAPYTNFNTVFTWGDQRVDIETFTLNSRAAAIVAEGGFDLSRSRFEDLSVAARLLQPGVIAPNLGGRDVRIALVLNGAMATPRVAYRLTAATLSFSERTLVNFQATGAAQVNADRIIVPVAATADRLDGLPEQLGGLLTNVRLNGDLMIEGANILSDNLRLRSDRADAVLAIAFDIGRGRYNVGIQGRVNEFLIQSVGIVDITSDFDVVSQGGGFGLQGRVAIRTRRIFNETAVEYLGGMATATATIAIGGDGAIRFGDVRLVAPKLRITEGGGVYYPDGRLSVQLRGTSIDFGTVSASITGTIDAPRIELKIAKAGFGVGLADVTATIVATGGGYRIDAAGQSNYGPFSAKLLYVPGRPGGPLTRIEITELLIAGMRLAGNLTQTPSGAFATAPNDPLRVSGDGIGGTIALSAAEGGRQRVEIDATANNAVIPSSLAGTSNITIARALIDVGITLAGEDDPLPIFAANGGIQVAGLRHGTFVLNQARADFDYPGAPGVNGGNVKFVAEGSSGAVPFDVAGNASVTPTRVRLALQGSANNIPFRFAEPGVIEREVGRDAEGRQAVNWVLRPTNVLFSEGQGTMRLAGSFGSRGTVIQSRLDSFDISIANTLRPGLGVGGQATGSLDFFLPTGGAFPRAEARLNIRNFTRTGIAIRSVPIDISLSGNLRPESGLVAAVFRQGGAVVGRLRADLEPLPPGSGDWTARLAGATFREGSGIRYNGPASVLVSLAGLTGHQLQGPVAIGADFRGRVDDPQLNGVARAQNVTYTNENYGTRITNLALSGTFDGSRLQVERLTGRAGDGTVNVTGYVDFRPVRDPASRDNPPRLIYPVSFDVALADARLARSDDLAATATGTLRIRHTATERPTISGQLELGEIRYQIVRNTSARVVNLSGVCRRGPVRQVAEGMPVIPSCDGPPQPANVAEQQQGDDDDQGVTMPGEWSLDIGLVADNRIFVSGMGLESEWSADLNVGGTTSAPQLSGNIELVRGTLSFAGRRFILDDQSRISFAGGNGLNPQLNIIAEAEVDDVTIGVEVRGSSTNPQIRFTANPDLPQDEIVSRILFGSSVTEISAIQAIQLAASLNSLRGGSGGLDPLGALQNATGIQRLRILGEDEATGRGTALAAGFYLSDDIYIEIITDARGFTATQLEFSLSKTLSLLSQFGTQSGTNVNLRYSRDY